LATLPKNPLVLPTGPGLGGENGTESTPDLKLLENTGHWASIGAFVPSFLGDSTRMTPDTMSGLGSGCQLALPTGSGLGGGNGTKSALDPQIREKIGPWESIGAFVPSFLSDPTRMTPDTMSGVGCGCRLALPAARVWVVGMGQGQRQIPKSGKESGHWVSIGAFVLFFLSDPTRMTPDTMPGLGCGCHSRAYWLGSGWREWDKGSARFPNPGTNRDIGHPLVLLSHPF